MQHTCASLLYSAIPCSAYVFLVAMKRLCRSQKGKQRVLWWGLVLSGWIRGKTELRLPSESRQGGRDPELGRKEGLAVGETKGKCPKLGLFFPHKCCIPTSHFPPPPLPHSFFLSWGNQPASHVFSDEGTPSLVGCVPLWQDTWIHKPTSPRMQRASFQILRKVIFQWG